MMTLLIIDLHPTCHERETVTIAFEKGIKALQLTAVSAATQNSPYCFTGKNVSVVVSAHKSLLSDSGKHDGLTATAQRKFLRAKGF